MARKDTATTPTPDAPREAPRLPPLAEGFVESPRYPNLHNAPPFWLAWHPERWMVRHGKLIPDLAVIPHVPNVDGAKLVIEGGMVKVDARKLAAQVRRDGYSLIDYSHGPGGAYLRHVGPSPDGLGMWVDAWTTTYPGSSAKTCDLAARDAWAASLVGKVIQPPARYVLERLLGEHQAALRNLEPLLPTSDDARQRAKHHNAALAAIEAALSESTQAAPAA